MQVYLFNFQTLLQEEIILKDFDTSEVKLVFYVGRKHLDAPYELYYPLGSFCT